MVRKVGVHDDDKVSERELQALDVGGAQSELAGAGFEDYARRTVGVDELFGHILRAVGGIVIDDDYFQTIIGRLRRSL